MKSIPKRQINRRGGTAVAMFLVGVGYLIYGQTARADTGRASVVNMYRVLHEAVPAVQAEDRLKQEFAPREQEVQNLARQGLALQAQYEKSRLVEDKQTQQRQESQLAKLSRNFEIKKNQLAADLVQRRNQEMAQLQNKIRLAIQQVAQQDKLDLVLYDGIAYNAPSMDITNQVINALSSK